ncbi:flagellar hook-length control protein FliK [Brenneria populi subsp. brevivirga]|uniref:flagellar hook-length control protein FliK n=1 Tax=Brenneria populi TaxID=1505588 RepID=UPI002E19F845|nr:flagellar hook-length control protein FliK [Brenneria populi subsp. brevivirga]
MKLSALPITTSIGDIDRTGAASLLRQGKLPEDFAALLEKQSSLPSDLSGNKPVKALLEKQLSLPSDLSGNKSVEALLEKQLSRPSDLSGNRPVEALLEKQLSRPSDLSGNRPVEALLEKQLSRPSDLSDGRSVDMPQEKPLPLPSARLGDKPVEELGKEALPNKFGKKTAADSNSDGLHIQRTPLSSSTDPLSPANTLHTDVANKSNKIAVYDDRESDTVNDKVIMQALLAMLPPETAAVAPTVNNSADDTQNVMPALSSLNHGKKQAEGALFDTQGTADDGGDTLSTRIDITGSATKESGSALTSSAPHNTAKSDDSASLAASSPLIVDERHSQESTLLSGGQSAPSPHISLTPNIQSASVGNTATHPAYAQLNTPFGSQQWQDTLNQQIVMFSRNGQQTAELRLNPQDLGTLHISLKIDDNQAQIHLASANSQVRSALEAALPHLRNAMAESGISLGQSSVGSDTSGWQAQQQMANNSGEERSGTFYQQQFGNAPENITEHLAVPAHLQSMASSENGVDLFA